MGWMLPPAEGDEPTAGALTDAALGDGHPVIQVHILNRVEKLDTLGHRALEGLATENEAHTTGTLINDGRFHRVGEVIISTGSHQS